MNILTGKHSVVAKLFGDLYKVFRHVLLRLWERWYVDVDGMNGLVCDFWLVCHSKDWQTVRLTIESIYRYSLNPVGTIFIVGNEVTRPNWVPEGISYMYEGELPVTAEALDILKDVSYKGWILQQLLKYSGMNYSERFVTIDCDTVLLKPHLFFTNSGTVLRLSYEHSPHYRTFEKSLNINAGNLFSFTSHMMPFKSDLLRALIARIEKITNQSWVFYICNYAKQNGMVVSEYNLYARYILDSEELITYRPWLNKTVPLSELNTIDNLKIIFPDRNSVSFHNSADRGPHIIFYEEIKNQNFRLSSKDNI